MAITGTLKLTTPSDREIELTRVFHASRRLVWKTMTEPELLKRWLLGPPGWAMTFCENSLELGASFRWMWRGPDGQVMVMRGFNREVVPLELIVRTESFDFGCDAKVGEQLATLVLTEAETDGDGGGSGEDRDRHTALTLTVLYPSKAARDAMITSGMEHSMAATYDRLEVMLAALQAHKSMNDAA
jgi:uncharacterized protein YndB with AHSA1/START domain